jgi:hypothetical protein
MTSRQRQKAQIPDLDESYSYPTHLINSASVVISPTKVTRTISSTVPRKRKSRNVERNPECDEEAVSWELPEMGNTENVERSCELGGAERIRKVLRCSPFKLCRLFSHLKEHFCGPGLGRAKRASNGR